MLANVREDERPVPFWCAIRVVDFEHIGISQPGPGVESESGVEGVQVVERPVDCHDKKGISLL
jgi:hypothetical protein